MKAIEILTTILAVFVWVDAAWSEIIHVPEDFETIQGAINESEDGDTVLVQPGEYVENIDFDGKDITVASLQLVELTGQKYGI